MREHRVMRRTAAILLAALLCLMAIWLTAEKAMALEPGPACASEVKPAGGTALSQAPSNDDKDEDAGGWVPKEKIEFTPGIIALASVCAVIGLFISYRRMKQMDKEDMERLAREKAEAEAEGNEGVIVGSFRKEDEE